MTDIRVFEDDPNIYKTLDRDLIIHQIAPSGLKSDDVMSSHLMRKQWKPCVIESIRRRAGKVHRDVTVMFTDHSRHTVSETEIRRELPKSIREILDSDDEKEEEEEEEEEEKKKKTKLDFRKGDRVYAKPIQKDMILRCSFPGCAWHIQTPSEKRNCVMWANNVARVHRHEMIFHIENLRPGQKNAFSIGEDFETSFILTIVNAQDITTLKRHAPTTFVEILFVDRRFRLANGSFRVLRRFLTSVVPDTDSPYWNEQIKVKDITSTALRMQLILWEDTKKAKVPTKSNCLGHVTFDFCSVVKSKDKNGDKDIEHFVPRIGRGSGRLPHSKAILLPHLHTSRVLSGTPTGDDGGGEELGMISYRISVL